MTLTTTSRQLPGDYHGPSHSPTALLRFLPALGWDAGSCQSAPKSEDWHHHHQDLGQQGNVLLADEPCNPV